MSSQEFERGLMANIVARRCTVLEREENRELVWFIQLLSHQSGGLNKLAADLCARFEGEMITPSMKRFGCEPGRRYSAEQVRQVRAEIPAGLFDFRLKGETDYFAEANSPEISLVAECLLSDEVRRQRAQSYASLATDAASQPDGYPASTFAARCQGGAADELEKCLSDICINPALKLEKVSPWYFPTLIAALGTFMAEWKTRYTAAAVTSIGQRIYDALDYVLETQRLVLIDGNPRLGKSTAAKSWAAMHPGSVRYVELESGNDEISFFRQIARSLGVSINLNSKAQELKQRIADTLQTRQLMLILDEAHWCFPQTLYRHALPHKINWLMTALINRGVSVALITTPQFFRSQKAMEEHTCWTSEQFTGRIGHYEKLPTSLSADDLKAVAIALLPDADEQSIEHLVLYAQSSAKYLAGMDAIVSRARFVAHKDNRKTIKLRDIKCALKESVIPSDKGFSEAMSVPSNPLRKRAGRDNAQPLQPAFQAPEMERETPASQRGTTRVNLSALTQSRIAEHAEVI